MLVKDNSLGSKGQVVTAVLKAPAQVYIFPYGQVDVKSIEFEKYLASD
jgi:hypothetical protein